jgi:thymidylate synthase-like protein
MPHPPHAQPASPSAIPADSSPPEPAISLADTTLEALFDRARSALLRRGALHETPRGFTRSLNGVALTWVAPERDTTPLRQWTPEEIQWYLDSFVAKRPENDPAQPASPGALVFPYTYAARSRFWDGGWGYLAALAEALRAAGATVEEATASRTAFDAYFAAMGERLHLQTALSLCALYPPAQLRRWLAAPDLLAQTLRAWRRDLLDHAIEDIAETPESRRAVVASLCYPQLEDQLRPRMGMPPYQLFQFLPGEANGPLSSIHVHRSLDVDGGAPLDFHHDLAWLREASARTGRPVGDITVIVHNLHAYIREETDGARESIGAWLCRVTDGYTTGEGTPRAQLARPAYAANIERIWARWQSEENA